MKPHLNMELYLITDPDVVAQKNYPEILEACLKNGVTLVQLREKTSSTREMIKKAKVTKRICDRYNVPLIIDDRCDVALAVDAAGVHVGAEDMPVAVARKVMGPDKIVGATAKNVAAALQAETDGADYIGTGAIYPTTTKVVTVLTDVETLKDVVNTVNIPVNAIGGLNASNIDILEGSGIAGICVVTALMKAEDPGKATRELLTRVRELGLATCHRGVASEEGYEFSAPHVALHHTVMVRPGQEPVTSSDRFVVNGGAGFGSGFEGDKLGAGWQAHGGEYHRNGSEYDRFGGGQYELDSELIELEEEMHEFGTEFPEHGGGYLGY